MNSPMTDNYPAKCLIGAVVYLRRIRDDELDDLFAELAAIAIDGPKAVGKTTRICCLPTPRRPDGIAVVPLGTLAP